MCEWLGEINILYWWMNSNENGSLSGNYWKVFEKFLLQIWSDSGKLWLFKNFLTFSYFRRVQINFVLMEIDCRWFLSKI